MARRLPRARRAGLRHDRPRRAGADADSPFATTRPGVYAVGDVRSGSVKRVASGVGEGSVVVQAIHRFLNPRLAERRPRQRPTGAARRARLPPDRSRHADRQSAPTDESRQPKDADESDRPRTTTTTQSLTSRLGPGLITGAADDDPSGIATYSQAGAQFRFALVWTLFLTTPLMIGIQMLSARIGCVTREGLATNIAQASARAG